MLQPFYSCSCSSLVLESPFLPRRPPSDRRLCRAADIILCALHSLVHSCETSTRTRLRSLPPSLAFPLSCTHASHALPLTQACPSPETPQAHTGRRQRSCWASNAESWCRGGHRHFACMSEVTTWAWLLLQVELMTSAAGGHATGDATQRAQGITRHGEGATSWCQGGASTFCMHMSEVTTWAATFAYISDITTWGKLLHASQM